MVTRRNNISSLLLSSFKKKCPFRPSNGIFFVTLSPNGHKEFIHFAIDETIQQIYRQKAVSPRRDRLPGWGHALQSLWGCRCSCRWGYRIYVQGTIQQRTYIAIDLKSFYASVECVDRGLDPLTTNLVVADVSRTEKTICLAVSPSLKASFRLWTYRVFQCHHHCRYRAVGRYHLTHRWLRLNQQEPNLKCFVEFHNFNR